MSTIKLESVDGKVFEVEVEAVQQSVTIKTMLDDLGFTKEEEDVPIPLPNVTGPILKKVIEWITYHKDDPPATENENAERRTDDIGEWDQEFLKIENNTLFELILAANYLDIKGLLDLTCKTVANMIKGKTPAYIRKVFKLDEKASQNKKQDTNETESKEIKEESKSNEAKKIKQENKDELEKVKEENKEEPMQVQEIKDE